MQVRTGITNLIVFSIILRMVICFSEHETEENPGVKKITATYSLDFPFSNPSTGSNLINPKQERLSNLRSPYYGLLVISRRDNEIL